jgi:(p)ppGpp synthase/HD superfamily hydrolase
MNTTDYSKLRLTIRSQLKGMAKEDPTFFDCLKALNLAESRIHTGMRKDGKTKEFYHQLSILGFLITQHQNLANPRAVYMAAILHDTPEDYPEYSALIREMFPNDFVYAQRLSKIDNDGNKIPYATYFSEMARCPVCSAVKLVDRIHNTSTMPGVFSREKMRKYIDEIVKYFLPMAKDASDAFPEQEAFYELAKSVLSMKVASYTYFLDEIDRANGKTPKQPQEESGPSL